MGYERGEFELVCPCGKGTILIRTEEPDHGWGDQRATASAHVVCVDCKERYVAVNDDWSQRKPHLALLSEVTSHQVAKEAFWIASKNIEGTPEAQTLVDNIVDAVNAERTKKAKHRLLTSLGLENGSYQTFLKHGFSEQALRNSASGYKLARIGSVTGLAGDNADYFVKEHAVLSDLDERVGQSKPHRIEIEGI